MPTGFSLDEQRLSRLVSHALQAGVPRERLGMTGMRTVGPLAQLAVGHDGVTAYFVNNDSGIYLGRTYADAAATLRALIAEVSP